MVSRFGLALILIGLISLVVLVLTFQIGEADTYTFLLGVSLTLLGLLLRRRAARRQGSHSQRFRLLRRSKGGEEESI
jgi:hypothetical protein